MQYITPKSWETSETKGVRGKHRWCLCLHGSHYIYEMNVSANLSLDYGHSALTLLGISLLVYYFKLV